ncbi:MAG: lipopolysaccharide biosynthesis protein [Gammaproteobacteria bacterium]|nr:MAG: lipopolysaccharide biosynthesis protein [Gammaproteobacteria bacterium]
MAVPLNQLVKEAWGEVRRRKALATVLVVVVSFGILGLGLVWPYKYTSRSVIFVDDQNIIRPLMEGSAVTTKVKDRASDAREIIYSRQVLEKLVNMQDLWGVLATPEQKEAKMQALRKQIKVSNTRSKDFFAISYTDTDPDRAYWATLKITQLFISVTDESKKAESRAAYDFVDRQVKAYQAQLQASEERLKDFLSKNVEGTEGEVNKKIARLLSDIEATELEIREAQAERDVIRRQLTGEARMVAHEVAGSEIRKRIQMLENQLDTLRLSYKDTYPDIVSLKQQIADLKVALKSQVASGTKQPDSEAVLNPIYQSLRSDLAKVEARMETLATRRTSLDALLEQEKKRMEKIQKNKAKIAELTRDYEVNREIYNDLLKRREKARVSMRIDVEGHGLRYRIQEPPSFPLAPEKIRFEMFAGAGLLLGLLAPFGLALVYVQMDRKLRAADQIEQAFQIPVLSTVPVWLTSADRRKEQRQWAAAFAVLLLSVGGYGTLLWLHYHGGLV